MTHIKPGLWYPHIKTSDDIFRLFLMADSSPLLLFLLLPLLPLALIPIVSYFGLVLQVHPHTLPIHSLGVVATCPQTLISFQGLIFRIDKTVEEGLSAGATGRVLLVMLPADLLRSMLSFLSADHGGHGRGRVG
jgi:hypothetical protein